MGCLTLGRTAAIGLISHLFLADVLSTVDMGGEGGSQKKCDLRDFFAELWFEKLDEMYNNQRWFHRKYRDSDYKSVEKSWRQHWKYKNFRLRRHTTPFRTKCVCFTASKSQSVLLPRFPAKPGLRGRVNKYVNHKRSQMLWTSVDIRNFSPPHRTLAPPCFRHLEKQGGAKVTDINWSLSRAFWMNSATFCGIAPGRASPCFPHF